MVRCSEASTSQEVDLDNAHTLAVMNGKQQVPVESEWTRTRMSILYIICTTDNSKLELNITSILLHHYQVIISTSSTIADSSGLEMK